MQVRVIYSDSLEEIFDGAIRVDQIRELVLADGTRIRVPNTAVIEEMDDDAGS